MRQVAARVHARPEAAPASGRRRYGARRGRGGVAASGEQELLQPQSPRACASGRGSSEGLSPERDQPSPAGRISGRGRCGGPERPGAGRQARRTEPGAGGRIAAGPPRSGWRIPGGEPVAGMAARAFLRARRADRPRGRRSDPGRLERARSTGGAPPTLACQNRVGPLVYSALRRVPLPPDARPALRDPQERVRRDGGPQRRPVPGAQVGPRGTLGGAHAGHRPEGRGAGGTVYPERALRPMADIDLLIREEDLEEAERRLAKHRLRGRARSTDEGRTEDGATTTGSSAVRVRAPATYRSSSTGTSTRRGGRPHGTSRRSSSGPRPRRSRESMLSCSCPEDFLLHLCVHLCRHRFNGGVVALCDIAATISFHGGRLDWTRFLRLADAARASVYAFVPLQLAVDLIQADVPAPVLGRLRRVGTRRRHSRARPREDSRGERGHPRGRASSCVAVRGVETVGTAQRAVFGNERSPGAGPNSFSVTAIGEPSASLRSLALGPGASPEPGSRRVVAREARKAELDTWCASPRRAPHDPP